MSNKEEEEDIPIALSDRLNNLENYLALNVLSDEMKALYAIVQTRCEDFRNNLFFKNVDILENEIGTMDKSEIPIKAYKLSTPESYNPLLYYDDLYKKFEEKSKSVKN